jgi:N-glycosylase/DNA lyase
MLGLGFRARYVAGAALALSEGRLDFSEVREMPYTEAKAELMKLDGVGEKVADCVLLFSLDRLEAFPVDRWVLRAVQDWYFRGARVTEKMARQCAARRFGQYAGYAQQYLFYGRRLEGDKSRKP